MSDARKPAVITVAVSRVDGGLTVMRVVTTEYRPTTNEEKAAGLGERTANWTIDPTPEYIAKIIAKHNWTGLQEATTWRVVPNDFVDEHTDSTFRNAWKDDNTNKPGVDMPKARDIHRDRIREARAPLLEVLDVEYQRADEDGDQQKKKQVADKKKALRDVTAHPDIEAAQTPEQLKAVWPQVLNGSG